jgi:hypothetical protein
VNATMDLMDTKQEATERRTRLIVDAEDVLNSAVQLRASKLSVSRRRKVTKSEVVTEILRSALAAEISEINSFDDKEPQPKRPRR